MASEAELMGLPKAKLVELLLQERQVVAFAVQESQDWGRWLRSCPYLEL